MNKNNLIRQRLERKEPVINFEKAEELISTAPSTLPEKKLIEEVVQKSKPSPKPKENQEPLQTYLLKYSKAQHYRVKMAVLKNGKGDIRDWINAAIDEKLARDGF